jgi:hypothetical protein
MFLGEERRKRELGHTYLLTTHLCLPILQKQPPSTNHLLTHCLLPTQGNPIKIQKINIFS